MTAYSYSSGYEQIVAQNQFDYGNLRNLVAERQQHAGTVSTSSPVVSYAWDYQPYGLGNYNRLASIAYPDDPTAGAGSSFVFEYGDTNDTISDILSRVTGIKDAAQAAYALYGYSGVSRRVNTAFGNGLFQDVTGTGGCPGLDTYGRIADLHYVDGQQSTVHRYQYTYDTNGNRTSARVTQADVDQDAHDNDRSFAYGYDVLQRLVSADRGELDTTQSPPVIDPASGIPTTSRTWTLDNLGNWLGDVTNAGLRFTLDANGDNDLADAEDTWRETSHSVTDANAISDVTEEVKDGGGPATTTFVNDNAGNLVFDGNYYYQYDGFNRLAQVNLAGSLTTADFDANGKLAGDPMPGPGDKVVAFVYDGLGRLIQQSRVVSEPAVDVEDYYYDGVRRVQEILTPNAGSVEMREYLYGPGYVDELLCQVDESGNRIFYLLDANYNVMALTDANGEVAVQYVWSPYGELVAADVIPTTALPNPPTNAAGHQGLFFVRLDGTSTDPAMEPGAFGLFCNRNRWYSPRYGRFTSRDPNKTALAILTALVMNGDTLDIVFGAMSSADHYGDGMNLYAYLGANPINLLDAMGLSWEDDDIDDLIDELMGQKVYALGVLNEGAGWVALGLQTSLDIAGSLLGVDVFQSVAVLASGRGGFWEGMDIVMAAVPGGGAFRAIAKARKIKRLAKIGKSLGRMVRHHTVPSAVLKRLSSKVANHPLVRGRRGAPNRWLIPEHVHKDLHRGAQGGPWNDAWWRELDAIGGPKKAQVEDALQIREKLVRIFGLEEYRP